MDLPSVSKENLLGVDFNINTPISIHCIKQSRNFVKPGEKYPTLFHGMEKKDFSTWKVSHLQEFLGDRDINRTGNKDTLVNNAYSAYKLDLGITATDIIEEKNEIELNHKAKLLLENGLVKLPDPSKLVDGWFEAPYNLPNTVFDQINVYLKDSDAGKAYKGGKSLLLSGHVRNVMTHSISPNIRYCFVKGLCQPEQKIGNNPYTIWVCLHKDSGAVVSGECMCVAG